MISKKKVAGLTAMALLALGWTLSGQRLPPPPPPGGRGPAPGQGVPGGPLPGLTPAQVALFNEGREDFLETETVEDGLGPAYNATGCAACHNQTAIGGAGNAAVLRAGSTVNGIFQEPTGGSLIHLFSNSDHRCQPRIPADANILARRIPTPIFGGGLTEAIPDQALIALEDPGDRNGDGIRGRAARIIDPATRTPRIGRFGWKAQHATLLAFAGDAYVNEMGITSDLFPNEVGAGLTREQLAACDPVPDPEDRRDPATGRRSIDRFENFMKFLAGPGEANGGPTAQRGRQLFNQIGCESCHVRAIATGPNAIPALNRVPVVAWSDWLLHDIGTGDGIVQGNASGGEFRTAPLWGMRGRKMLMHDGRALDPASAIGAHGGTAARSRDRFNALPPQDRQALIDFLNTL